MKNKRSIWHHGAALLTSIGETVNRHRRAREFANMPDHLLKDIGWPSRNNPCVTNACQN